jgi:hypothetical protein
MNLQGSGGTCREDEDAHSVVIARLDRATQYSEASVIEPKRRGVLDTPHTRGMTTFLPAAARHLNSEQFATQRFCE